MTPIMLSRRQGDLINIPPFTFKNNFVHSSDSETDEEVKKDHICYESSTLPFQ